MATCPSCGTENPDEARFCFSCGTALTAAAGRKERKFATALFADVVGSTTLGEREDPEVVQSLLGRAFQRLSQEVERHGGLLEKFMGDALLAVFGVPTAHEDDPERAVRAGLEMQAVLSELNRSLAAEGRPELWMRIGIEAGEVLVDLERTTGPRDRMLTGDAVNTAARLQTAADAGRVVVGPVVHAATKDVIDYEELPPADLKGKAQPLTPFRALRVRAKRRGERPALGLEAKLVGRDEELAVLKQTFHRIEGEHRPALVTVLGPAGVGKSRLVWELLKYLEGLDQLAYWRKGRCLSYGNLSYSALAEAVKAQCEVLEDDAPEVVAEKTRRAVQELFGNNEVEDHLLALVGGATDRTSSREELFDAWRRFLERMAARYPLVLVLEDIHWADSGLLDFIDYLADWAQGPIFILTLARPELLEMRPTWGGGKRNYSAIYLDALTAEENTALLDDLLTAALPQHLKDLVVDRSEGNPLYTEEIVRMFIDRGVLRRTNGDWELTRPIEDLEVPRSIQALIAARLDNLPSEEKSFLQDAAVVGRAFWMGAVHRLSGRPPDELRTALGRLRVKEIVIPREPPVFSGELEFAFRHVLIRDVAYETLPKSLRAEKHVEAARWAEERAGERSEEIAEVLADHYGQALAYIDELGGVAESEAVKGAAYRWSRLAADRAAKLWQQREAVRWYRIAIGLSEQVGEDRPALAQLWEGYGEACMGVEPFDEVQRAFQAALRLYDELEMSRDAGRLESRLARAALEAGKESEVTRWIERALARLEPLGYGHELAGALMFAGNYRWRMGRHEEAEPLLRRSIEIARAVGAKTLEGESLQSLGMALALGGRWRDGLSMMEQSFEIAREAGDLAFLLRSHNNLARTLMDDRSDYARARAILLEGLELARRTGRRDYETWILNNLSISALELGNLDEAERFATQCFESAARISYTIMMSMGLYGRASVQLFRARLQDATRLNDRNLRLQEEVPLEFQMESYQAVLEAGLAEALGEPDEAIGRYLKAIHRLAGQVDTAQVAVVLFETVRLLARDGRAAEAKPYADRLRHLATGRPHVEAFSAWADGLLAGSAAEAAVLLEKAASALESVGRRIDLARCLLDLGDAERRAGKDPRPSLVRARELVVETGANLYLPQVDAALAATPA